MRIHKNHPICTIDGCKKTGKIRRGMCEMHYRRWRVWGDTNSVKRHANWIAIHEKDRIKEKLFSQYTKDENGCWNWNGMKDDRGYGIIKFAHNAWRTHRVSAHVSWGFDLNSSLKICHKCDNRSCINPSHLFEGTQADNVHDMYEKKRSNPVHGEKVNTAKLTENDVRKIRILIENGGSVIQLAKSFGVARQTIWQICKRKIWKHVL